jgi:ATP-dependent Lon protease
MTADSRYREHARVLVADEDDGGRGLLTMLLHAHGYDAEGVASGDAVLALLRRREFDLVLLDAELLPRLAGLELLAAARRLAPDARFVMLTSFATVDMALAAMTHGAFDYLRKPLHTDELLRAIARALPEQAARHAPTTAVVPSVERRSTSH